MHRKLSLKNTLCNIFEFWHLTLLYLLWNLNSFYLFIFFIIKKNFYPLLRIIWYSVTLFYSFHFIWKPYTTHNKYIVKRWLCGGRIRTWDSQPQLRLVTSSHILILDCCYSVAKNCAKPRVRQDNPGNPDNYC